MRAVFARAFAGVSRLCRGGQVAGHLATFRLGSVAFQVFSVDFQAAEQPGASVWNPKPPAPLAVSLLRIWLPWMVVWNPS
jgi:hypothetical protein